MCKSSPPKDNSAEIARREEEARQARITQGQASIDQAFGGFNDDFYNKYQDDYLGYYNPQLNDQYDDAVERLTLQLAQTGNLTGSVGARQLADLQKFYDTQKVGITNQALGATNDLRSNIDTRKSQLYTDNRAAADPGNAASAAASAVTALQPAPPSSPLANVFGSFFNDIGNVAAIKNAQQFRQGTGVQSFGGSNNNSVYNVG
jgi:hypothetical protein